MLTGRRQNILEFIKDEVRQKGAAMQKYIGHMVTCAAKYPRIFVEGKIMAVLAAVS